jgi:hypothetical protein
MVVLYPGFSDAEGGGGAVVCRALLNTTNWLGFQCFHSRPSPQVTRSTTSWSTRSSTTRELPPPLPVYTTDATSGQKSCAGSKRALGVTIRFDINHGGSARSLAPPVPRGHCTKSHSRPLRSSDRAKCKRLHTLVVAEIRLCNLPVPIGRTAGGMQGCRPTGGVFAACARAKEWVSSAAGGWVEWAPLHRVLAYRLCYWHGMFVLAYLPRGGVRRQRGGVCRRWPDQMEAAVGARRGAGAGTFSNPCEIRHTYAVGMLAWRGGYVHTPSCRIRHTYSGCSYREGAGM